MKRSSANILCEDPAKAAAFYERLLGMTRRFDFGWFVLLTHADMADLEFGLLDRGHETVPRDLATAPAGVIVSFVVADVEPYFEDARAVGADIVQEPTDLFYGQRRMLLRDPEGTVVDISSPTALHLPEASLERAVGPLEDDASLNGLDWLVGHGRDALLDPGGSNAPRLGVHRGSDSPGGEAYPSPASPQPTPETIPRDRTPIDVPRPWFSRTRLPIPGLFLVSDSENDGRISVDAVARDVTAVAVWNEPVAESCIHVLDRSPDAGFILEDVHTAADRVNGCRGGARVLGTEETIEAVDVAQRGGRPDEAGQGIELPVSSAMSLGQLGILAGL